VSLSASLSASSSASPSLANPTAGYDIAVLDQSGVDLLDGAGVNRDGSASEMEPIVYSGTSLNVHVAESDTLTVEITGNTAASAYIGVTLYWALGA
jgi:hypothetical protein